MSRIIESKLIDIFENKQEKGLEEKGDQSLFFAGLLKILLRIVEFFVFTFNLKNYKVRSVLKTISEKDCRFAVPSFSDHRLKVF